MGNPFAFRIDYAAEIAKDEAQIALLESPLMIAAARLHDEAVAEVPVEWRGSMCSVHHLIQYKPGGVNERAAVFGLTPDDVRAWEYATRDLARPWDGPDPQPGDYRRGREVSERMAKLWIYGEAQRVELLRRAKNRLAAHKRNQKKYTGK